MDTETFRNNSNALHIGLDFNVDPMCGVVCMIENDKMLVHSKPFISELKNYVATGSSYQAKLGSTDDLISATLLAIRMMAVLKDWDPRIYNTFNQAENMEDYTPPMPIFVSSNY